MIRLAVTGLTAVVEALDQVKRDVDFAGVMAATRSAKVAQSAIIDRTKRIWHVRKTWLESGKYAVRVKPATKGAPFAEVWNDSPWATQHEEGREKAPRRTYLTVPQVGGPRADEGALIPKAMRAPALLPVAYDIRNRKPLYRRGKGAGKGREGRRGWIMQTASGPMLMVRTGAGRGPESRKPMYAMEPRVRVPADWKFRETGIMAVDRSWDKIQEETLREVLRLNVAF